MYNKEFIVVPEELFDFLTQYTCEIMEESLKPNEITYILYQVFITGVESAVASMMDEYIECEECDDYWQE